MTKDMRLAEMLSTRLCHDLTGPIGAVSNGAEFLSEEGFDMQGQAVELIVNSAKEAVHRLQFYRLAYGRVNDKGEASLADKKAITENFFSGSKISLDWPDNHTDAMGVSVSNKMARLLMNMMIIASGTMIRGGMMSIRLGHDETTRKITITCTGESIKWEDDYQTIFAGNFSIDNADPKTVQPLLTYMLSQELNAQLQYEVSDTEFTFTVTQDNSVVG